jgi:hypothetical protein
VAAGAALLAADHSLFNGNYLLQQGATGAAVLTGRPALFPGAVWWALQLVALTGGALMAAVLATLGRPSLSPGRLGNSRALLVLFSMLTALSLCLFEGLTKGTVFDRYLWPLDFSLAVLLLTRRAAPSPGARQKGAGAHARPSRAPAGGAGVAAPSPGRAGPFLPVVVATAALSTVVAAVAAVITVNADAYDAARWTAGNKAVAAGVRATMVDAGFEWVGSHQAGIAVTGRRVPGVPFYDAWYDQMFPAFAECAFVSGNRISLASLRPRAEVTYQEFGFAGPQDLYVYLLRRPGC